MAKYDQASFGTPPVTVHEKTANIINRAHDYPTYVEGVNKLRKHGIRICSHIINGLPLETPEMMMETAKEVAKLDVQGSAAAKSDCTVAIGTVKASIKRYFKNLMAKVVT